MTVEKIIDVNKFVITPSGDAYSEPIIDSKSRIMLEEKDDKGNNVWRFTHQLEKNDTPVYTEKKLGNIITFALDRLDDKVNGETIRQRFALSCRVEAAMKNGGLLKVVDKDWKCIEDTLESIKNPLFNYRIKEAIDTAEIVKE